MYATGRCPSCGLKMGERGARGEKPGMYRCRKCKAAIRVLRGGDGAGSLIETVPNEHGELDLRTIPRV